MNYYNEHDPKAAAWLRELISQNQIPAGHVDERSIVEIKPHELAQYTQCHFFAGIGGWSYALQLAGVPSTQPVWTGSCPCQPFSTAGQQKGQADERHLWPAFFNLIRECRPEHVFGEQVANAVGHGWLDGISADLEGEDYSCGAAVLGAHSVGAPHIRQRLYWVANNNKHERPAGQHTKRFADITGCGQVDSMADSDNWRLSQFTELNGKQEDHPANRHSQGRHIDGCSDFGGVGNTSSTGTRRHPGATPCSESQMCCKRNTNGMHSNHNIVSSSPDHDGVAQPSSRGLQDEDQQHGNGGQTSGLGQADQFGIGSAWSAAAHVECRDGKIRRIPVEPGLFPLAHGVPGRVGLLRGSGNAIVPQTAAVFIKASFEALNDPLLGVW
jgi:DNA (cytosine-5)-methyltransferase 1